VHKCGATEFGRWLTPLIGENLSIVGSAGYGSRDASASLRHRDKLINSSGRYLASTQQHRVNNDGGQGNKPFMHRLRLFYPQIHLPPEGTLLPHSRRAI
jgi:hypothetical protein